MDPRPNILFIMSDEHDPAVTGCYGDPAVQTPNLDALATRGTVFENCYCNSPLCVPSRQSFTAGRYISRIGAWSNNHRMPDADRPPTLPETLRMAGYTPYLCGKQHYDADRRYGFEDLLPDLGSNGDHKTGHGGRRAGDDMGINHASWDQRSAEFYVGDDSGILNHDRQVTAGAVDFLRGDRAADGPWFLFAGYLAPHFPMIVPEEHAMRYLGVGNVPPTQVIPEQLASQPLNYHHLRRGFGVTDTDPAVVQRGRELYWALTDWFDGQVGQVLNALGDSEQADNTVVIYTSDHGENKGDHGLWWKNCMYDHGARIPLIVSYPARWAGGQRRSAVCSLVDVVKMVAGIAGAETPGEWDGDSLLPVMDDAAHPWKDTALSEYYGHNIASGFTMWRNGRWKYVYHNRIDDRHGPERQLFDMEADPSELNNLADDPAQAERVAALHAEMLAELGEDPDAIEQRCREDMARGYT